MFAIAFQYNFSNFEWVRCEKEEYIQEEIEKLPCLLIYEDRTEDEEHVLGYRVLCPKHNMFEVVVKFHKDYVQTADGCVIEGLIAPCDYNLEREIFYRHSRYPSFYVFCGDSAFSPFRWRVFQRDTDATINITCDLANIDNWRFFKHGELNNWRQFSFSANMRQAKLQITAMHTRKFIARNRWVENDIEFPPIVVDTAIKLLQTSVQQTVGIKSCVQSQVQAPQILAAYVERPLDPHIVFLKNFLWLFFKNDFDRVFPYEMKNNYLKICQLLDITPPESVQKAYSKNPYAIIWYMIFQQWGIKKNDLIQPFLYLDDNIGGISLHDLYYDPSKHCVLYKQQKDKWLALSHHCAGLLAKGKEQELLRWLYQVSSSKKITDSEWLDIHCEYYRDMREAKRKSDLSRNQ